MSIETFLNLCYAVPIGVIVLAFVLGGVLARREGFD